MNNKLTRKTSAWVESMAQKIAEQILKYKFLAKAVSWLNHRHSSNRPSRMWVRILKLVIGALLVAIGLFALLTPFTPGSWLALVGLEMLGVRIALWDKVKAKFKQ